MSRSRLKVMRDQPKLKVNTCCHGFEGQDGPVQIECWDKLSQTETQDEPIQTEGQYISV